MADPLAFEFPVSSGDDADDVQAKEVPDTPEVNAMEAAASLHTACEEGVATAFGVGFTVTALVIALPEHPFAVGVIV